jgi:hypothetical protein
MWKEVVFLGDNSLNYFKLFQLVVKNIIKRRLDYAKFCNHRKM